MRAHVWQQRASRESIDSRSSVEDPEAELLPVRREARRSLPSVSSVPSPALAEAPPPEPSPAEATDGAAATACVRTRASWGMGVQRGSTTQAHQLMLVEDDVEDGDNTMTRALRRPRIGRNCYSSMLAPSGLLIGIGAVCIVVGSSLKIVGGSLVPISTALLLHDVGETEPAPPYSPPQAPPPSSAPLSPPLLPVPPPLSPPLGQPPSPLPPTPPSQPPPSVLPPSAPPLLPPPSPAPTRPPSPPQPPPPTSPPPSMPPPSPALPFMLPTCPTPMNLTIAQPTSAAAGGENIGACGTLPADMAAGATGWSRIIEHSSSGEWLRYLQSVYGLVPTSTSTNPMSNASTTASATTGVVSATAGVVSIQPSDLAFAWDTAPGRDHLRVPRALHFYANCGMHEGQPWVPSLEVDYRPRTGCAPWPLPCRAASPSMLCRRQAALSHASSAIGPCVCLVCMYIKQVQVRALPAVGLPRLLHRPKDGRVACR